MTFTENIRLGMDGLLSHKLRSILTMLGIIFGVAAVIAMQSIGAGAKRELLDAIKVLGVNNIIIRWNEQKDEELANAVTKNPRQLSVDDVHSLRNILTDALHLVPLRYEELTVRLPNEQRINLVGTSPEYSDLLSLTLFEGRFLSADDGKKKLPVAVLSNSLKRKLFPLRSAVGEQVKVDDTWLTVVGVIQPPVGNTKIQDLQPRDTKMDLYIPLETMQARFQQKPERSPLQEIIIQVKKEDQVRSMAPAAERILNRLHRGANDFSVIVPVELLKQSQQTQRIFNIVMGAIASISLLVGGIGIMNIMLSNVLERTREIGVRRAVGAKHSDVVAQFLIEAILLSIIGGIIGVILGSLMAWGITLYAGWTTVIGLSAVLVAFGVSAGVGILFGWWPAKKAASMDVINALRYE